MHFWNISLVFVYLWFVSPSISVNFNLISRYEEMFSYADMESVMSVLLGNVMDEVNCFLILLDDYYQNVMGNSIFVRPFELNPYFKILVNESEDLLSPNYETVKVIHEVKKNSCNLYVIFLANGEQSARFLLFGDRHRTVDSRAKFVLIKDRRLFSQKYNVLWKKLVNVIFIKQYKNTRRFELSTVPFPPSLSGPIIPYRIKNWNNKNVTLFPDKTSNLQGQTLKVVTFEHVPTTAVILPNNDSQIDENRQPTYVGLEIEVLKTLSEAMKFHFTIYEPPNANEEQWGRLQTNGSFSGLLGEMCSGKADIALGNLYYTPYHLQMLDLSVPYNAECLTFLTPESLTDNSWQTLILPFQGNMWTAVIVSLFVGVLTFYLSALYHRDIENRDFTSVTSASTESNNNNGQNMHPVIKFLTDYLRLLRGYLRSKWKRVNREKIFFKRYNARYASKKHLVFGGFQHRLNMFLQSNKAPVPRGLYIFDRLDNSILYTYGMFMTVSLPKVPTVWSIRMFTGWWWLYCILVSVAYKASMTANLANPPPTVTIDNLEQLADSDVKCGGWGEQAKEFFVTSLDVASQKVGRKFEVTYKMDSVVERVASGRFAYYENVYYLHYLKVKHKDINVIKRYNDSENEKNIDKTQGKILHVMTQCVINMPISVGLQKNSPLKPKIDSYLRRVVEAGLVKKWLNDAMFKIRTTEAELEKTDVKAIMNLSKLYGAFAVLLGGYAISLIYLVVEMVSWYGIEKRNPNFDKYNLRMYYAQKKNKHEHSLRLT